MSRIPATELQQLIGEDQPTLLDVRSHVEAASGRLPGGIVVPRRDVELRVPRLLTERTRSVVCYDDGRTVVGTLSRADLAAAGLRRQGFREARSLDGGLPAWSGLLEPGVNVRSKRFGERVSHEDDVAMLPADEFLRWQQDRRDVLLVDVRPPEEHARGCVPGAVNIPGIELARHAATLAASGMTVVTHCAGRTRGIIAAQTLRLLGVPEVVTLENGTQGWMLAGHPLEKTPEPRTVPHPSPIPAEVLDRLSEVRHVRTAEVADGGFAHVFDVRTASDYHEQHAAGADHAPGTQLVQATDEYVGEPSVRIAVMDGGGDDPRARLTGYWLERMGYDVAVVTGGLREWTAAGLPTERGPGEDGRGLVLPALSTSGPEADLPVLDVDRSTEYAAGHVPGSVWVSRDWLEADVAELVDRATGAALVCRHPGAVHARLAAAALQAQGYDQLRLFPVASSRLTTADPRWSRSPDDVKVPPHELGRQAMLDYLAWETALHE